MVEGQIEGAFVQGLGFALFEEMVWNGAQLINPTLMDYKIPTFMEAPSELQSDYRGVHTIRVDLMVRKASARSASTASPQRSPMQ